MTDEEKAFRKQTIKEALTIATNALVECTSVNLIGDGAAVVSGIDKDGIKQWYGITSTNQLLRLTYGGQDNG